MTLPNESGGPTGFGNVATTAQGSQKRPKLANILEGVSKTLKANFDSISAEIEHNLSKGKERERVLVNQFLEAYLPNRFGLANGEIVSTDGQVSGECDIIIYDAATCPVLKKDGYQIVPVEAAYATIEVKSRLTTDELLKSANSIAAIKKMPKVAFYKRGGPISITSSLYGKKWDYFPMLGFVFGYTSIDPATLAVALEQFNRTIPPEHRIDVCILDSGGLIHLSPHSKNMALCADKDTLIGKIASDNPLMPFLVVLQNLILQSWTEPVRLSDYLMGMQLGVAHHAADPIQSVPSAAEPPK